mgnify:CR=1 FL=1
MKKILLFLASLFFLGLLVYVIPPSPEFPAPPPDALQSREPADNETPLRRAYFTNLTRGEVMTYYLKELKWGIRLNYPPEESKTLIRDQTRSTFLEEIVHPFRESVYINGFEPKEAKDAIVIGDKPWRQKIIVRYVPSSVWVRVLVVVLSFMGTVVLIKEWLRK